MSESTDVQYLDCSRAPEKTILALGAEMKSAPCLASPDGIFLCPDRGHLGNPDNYRAFVAAVDDLLDRCGGAPDAVAVDLHPAYAATRYAERLAAPVCRVQHHHAHIVACMVDRNVSGTVLGISCDGTGYGTDGAIWGCEVLVCAEADFTRAAHLRAFPLPGGDAAAIDTWRPAVSLLADAMAPGWFDTADARRLLARVDSTALSVTRARLAGASRPVHTTSLGRLFDAAAFITGLCDRNVTDADAPAALQRAAEAADRSCAMNGENREIGDGITMDQRPLVAALAAAAAAGEDAGAIAAGFHRAVADMLAGAAVTTAERTGISAVMLSGGCFFNRLLRELLAERLNNAGLAVYNHNAVSAGDAGIAVGQAVAAAARLAQD